MDADAIVRFIWNDEATRPSRETCEQCSGTRYVGEVPCSACNAMSESPRLKMGADHG